MIMIHLALRKCASSCNARYLKIRKAFRFASTSRKHYFSLITKFRKQHAIFPIIFLLILWGISYLIYHIFFTDHVTERSVFSLYSISVKAAGKSNQNISNATALTSNMKHFEIIDAHMSRYYYMSYQKGRSIALSFQSSTLTVTLLSADGTKINYHSSHNHRNQIISPSAAHLSEGNRTLIQIKNNSSYSNKFLISFRQEKEPKDTTTLSKKNLHPTSKAKPIKDKKANLSPTKYHKSTSKTKSNDKFSTIHPKNWTLYPQFVKLTANSVEKIHISNTKKTFSSKDFLWFVTNPDVISIENGTIKALSEGVSVIYIKKRNGSSLGSSCLVRVIKGGN